MISSMTAFARSETQTTQGTLRWEIKSLNQRHLDCYFRLADEFRGLEPKIRARISHALKRGKIECQLHFQPLAPEGAECSINEPLARQLARASRTIDSFLYNPSPASSIEILKWPGVLQAPQIDLEQLETTAMSLLEEALQQLVENRQREGEQLQELVKQRASGIQQQLDLIRQRMPRVRDTIKNRLQLKLAELSEIFDHNRLEQEALLLVQKSDIDEELDRLDAHLKELTHIFNQGGPCGRRLDFLMQEFNREANTIASKSADKEITYAAVELKVLIEQAREQIQNIE